ncbi:ADP-ribosylglycohydrolase family protein [Asanoa iriomotensis]|uniref:ADP-ribosylglycohydrolase n=1 Tax=Asanoa iriomotensis TaxID=234613 RepID=A0ABQ4BVV3_9ACTN|nr:ADP-ribosylglycohydrolase [Asanoa iriomotensis]
MEFLHTARIRDEYGPDGLTDLLGDPALITDDTQMTLFTAEGLIRASVAGVEPPAMVYQAHLRWLDTQRRPGPPDSADGWLAGHAFLYARRAPGNACMSGLSAGRMGTPASPANPHSKGCGAVMRSAPFGLDPRWTVSRAFDVAAECATQTHGHPSGFLAAGAFAAITHALVVGERDLPDAVEVALGLLRRQPKHDEVTTALERALALDRAVTPERVETLGGGWIAEEALAIALYAALAHPTDVRRALLAATNHSGDSDSTAAIAGNLLGAWRGEEALPPDWVFRLEGRGTILELADDLVFECTQGDQLHGDLGPYTGWTDRYPGS